MTKDEAKKLLEEGIETGDLEKIKTAKEVLFGSGKSPKRRPKPLTVKKKQPKMEKSTPAAPTAGRPEYDFTKKIRTEKQRRTIVTEDGEEKIYTRGQVASAGDVNLFEDDGNEEKDNLSKLYGKQAPRVRPASELISKECERCHKLFKVHPNHAKVYMCDRCVMRGRRD